MKRIGYLYEKIYDKENIRKAIILASQNKKKRRDIQRYLNNIDYYVNIIHSLLKNNKYRFTKGTVKTINENTKKREITIPLFRDLVVQYAVLNIITPILKQPMYKWSCGSIPKRGNLYAMKYVKGVIQKHKPKYALKLDVKKFYHNIDIKILHNKIKRRIKDKRVLDLIWQLLVVGSTDNKGIPIGYYTSQWFSNFYLTSLDHYIKQELKVKHYVRYVDDMICFGNNKRKLRLVRDKIIKFLNERLNLEIKDNYQLFPIEKRKVDFVGYIIDYEKVKIRKRNLKMLKRRAKQVDEKNNIYFSQSYLSYHSWYYHAKSMFCKFFIRMKDKARYYIANYSKEWNYD